MKHHHHKLKQLAALRSARAGQQPTPIMAPTSRPAQMAVRAAMSRVLTAKEYAEDQGISPSTARTRLEKLVASGAASRADAVRNGVRCVEYTLN